MKTRKKAEPRARLETHYSLVHAQKVLKLVRALWNEDPPSREDVFDATVDTWSNGREQGFHVSVTFTAKKENASNIRGRGVCFAQQRCSDLLVVIAGDAAEFDITTNMPSEELWASGRFEFYSDKAGARAIVDFLLTGDVGALAKAAEADRERFVRNLRQLGVGVRGLS